MKKLIATVLTLGALHFVQAQEAGAPGAPNQMEKAKRATPEQIATRNSMHLQKMLGLTEDQKQKTYQAVLTRTTALQAIRAKYGPEGDKKAMHQEAKPVKEQFVQTMDGILTPEQKTKWEQHRLKMKMRREHNKEMKGDKKPMPPKANEEPQKLMKDDDGIDD